MRRVWWVILVLVGLVWSASPVSAKAFELEARLVMEHQALGPTGRSRYYLAIRNDSDQAIQIGDLNSWHIVLTGPVGLDIGGPSSAVVNLPPHSVTLVLVPLFAGMGTISGPDLVRSASLPEGFYTLQVTMSGSGYSASGSTSLVVASGAEQPRLQLLQPDLTGEGKVTSLDISLTVAGFYRDWPPTIANGTQLTVYVKGTDADGATLTYTAANLPAGACFNGRNANGTIGTCAARQFLWTPSAAQGGQTYTVTFTVSDGTFTDTQTLPITVLNTQ